MQTFLPYASYADSARVIDPSRLGNQFYREGVTLLRGGWPEHPASRMWQGYEYQLCLYLLCCHAELCRRGKYYPEHEGEIRQTMRMLVKAGASTEPPPWLGDERVHSSHRGVLLWKKPAWYSRYNWIELPRPPRADGKMDYYWPTEETS